MEGKWFEAGCSGNIDFLHDAVRGDGAILQKLHSWGTTDTPLHLASMFGHAEFSTALGISHGHLEIVQFLLEFEKRKSALEELCMKKDRDGRTALHSAVVTGKISVIDLLFDHCPDAANEGTPFCISLLPKNNFRSFGKEEKGTVSAVQVLSSSGRMVQVYGNSFLSLKLNNSGRGDRVWILKILKPLLEKSRGEALALIRQLEAKEPIFLFSQFGDLT
ncbi:hypothetical protein Sango_0805800 [Sesamum angolense]|uniref:Uncharacterized protein n=1 Tax=Sesamum angolense TaxID=2727404 RepID=A0AAE2C0C0_9LAMI|nr:hypothetical protein Sango_0805800 [Sesamum angolense]